VSLLGRVVATLEREGVAHALIGAGALAAAGIVRSTLDWDLMVVDPSVLRPALWRSLEPAAAVEIRRGEADDPLAGLVRLTMDGERPVDLVVGRFGWQAEAISRAQRTQLEEGQVRVVGPADLILLKLFAGGPRDLWDVRELLELDEHGTLRRAVQALLEDLPEPLRESWRRV
jgi:hypothetical protein